MKPRLFPSNATSFANMGYGTIDAISCTVTEILNDEFTLEMKMLNTDQQFSRIQVGNIIAVKPNMTDPIQAFCIEQISKAINGEVDVFATHIAQYRSKLIPVSAYTSASLSAAISDALSNSAETNPFSLSTDKTVATGFTLSAPRSFRTLLGGMEGSLLDIYGGEYYYDNFDIQLLNHRGQNNGVRIFYGKNMVDFNAEDTFDWDDSATGVLPFWYSEDDGLVVGDIQYSDNVGDYAYNRTIVKDYSEDYDTIPTKAELESAASTWIASKGYPFTSLSVSFDDMVTDNRGKLIALGDTVQVINSMYDVKYSSRIRKMVFNVLLERYDEVEVGDLKKTINEAIAETVKIVKQGSLLNIGQDANGVLIIS